jgi:hypothetical protein
LPVAASRLKREIGSFVKAITAALLGMPSCALLTAAKNVAETAAKRWCRILVDPWDKSQRDREAMALTTCSASLPTPGKNPDDIA